MEPLLSFSFVPSNSRAIREKQRNENAELLSFERTHNYCCSSLLLKQKKTNSKKERKIDDERRDDEDNDRRSLKSLCIFVCR